LKERRKSKKIIKGFKGATLNAGETSGLELSLQARPACSLELSHSGETSSLDLTGFIV